MATADRVRVVVVDDDEDIRALLRLQFSKDKRFDVIGEGSDGADAICLAAELHPDLMILDQQMPVRTGLDALGDIKTASPSTSVILYTANADFGMSQAAFEAGAVEVLEKVATGRGLVEQLVRTLAEHESSIEIRVGPVSSAVARVWIANTRKILDAVVAHPEIAGTTIPPDVVEHFRSFFNQWDAVASASEEFRWIARAPADDIERVVTHWGEVDLMTDEQLDQLGVSWAPPEGAPFFEALTAGVFEGLSRHEQTKQLADRLGKQWDDYLKR